MENTFLIYGEYEYTYKDLIDQLSLAREYNKYIYVKENNPFVIFKKIILSMMYGLEIEIIDGDLSDREIVELGLEKKSLLSSKSIYNPIKLKEYNDLIEQIYSNKNRFRISIYTSGTTGRPKKVTHTFESITRNVKIDDKFKSNVWGFAYNPTHMAGLQVLFQAFFNRCKIVYLFGDKKEQLIEYLDKYKITNISATATYYRNVLPQLYGNKFESVKYITFGGEQCDKKVINKLSEIFPSCKFRNIYASTEAGSLFNSDGEVFRIKEELKPYIRINSSNELLINEKLLGISDNLKLTDGWYNTNDLVEMLNDGSFRFISRKSEIINVGGYKVNPLEVEDVLRELPDIKDAYVYARDNSVTGKLIAVDVIKESDLEEKKLKIKIKEYANLKLQPWKIPRIIKFVDNIEETRTGKRKRV